MAWRALQLFYWYAPGTGRLRQWFRRFDDARPLGRLPYAGARSCADIEAETLQIAASDGTAALEVEISLTQSDTSPRPIVIYSIPPAWGVRHPPADAASMRQCHAEAGYATVWIRHTGNDKNVMPLDVDEVEDRYAYIAESARDYDRARGHFTDIHKVLDLLEEWNAPGGRFEGRFDLSKIGLAGHSFAGRTAMVVGGALLHEDLLSYKDSRIKAAASFTLSPATDPHINPARWRAVDIPTLHVGGTLDIMWSSPTLPADSVRAYEKITAARAYRLMLKGADHVAYPGGRLEVGTARPRDELIVQWVNSTLLALWDAHLCGDADAEHWLKDELPKVLGRDGSFEWKDPVG